MARLLFALALFALSADALVMPFTVRSVRTAPRAAVSMGVEEDLIAAGDKCLEEGCPIDLVDELIEELKGECPYPGHP